MSSEFIVYTAITGGYDRLIQPVSNSQNVRFICLMDNPTVRENIWEVRELNCSESNAVLRAKHPKLFPERYLEPCVASMWIDGNIVIKRDLLPLFNMALEIHDLAFFAHPAGRTSIQEEVEACVARDKADPTALRHQLKHYQREGTSYPYPVIPAAYVIFRKYGSTQLNQVMQAWWDEIKRFTARDQISLPYVLGKSKYPFAFLPNQPLFNEYFLRADHHSKRGLARRMIASVRQQLVGSPK